MVKLGAKSCSKLFAVVVIEVARLHGFEVDGEICGPTLLRSIVKVHEYHMCIAHPEGIQIGILCPCCVQLNNLITH